MSYFAHSAAQDSQMSAQSWQTFSAALDPRDNSSTHS